MAKKTRRGAAGPEPIGARVDRLRVERGYSQTELARRAGLTQSHLNRILHGHRPIYPVPLRALAEALGVEEAVLTADTVQPPTLRMLEGRGEPRELRRNSRLGAEAMALRGQVRALEQELREARARDARLRASLRRVHSSISQALTLVGDLLAHGGGEV